MEPIIRCTQIDAKLLYDEMQELKSFCSEHNILEVYTQLDRYYLQEKYGLFEEKLNELDQIVSTNQGIDLREEDGIELLVENKNLSRIIDHLREALYYEKDIRTRQACQQIEEDLLFLFSYVEDEEKAVTGFQKQSMEALSKLLKKGSLVDAIQPFIRGNQATFLRNEENEACISTYQRLADNLKNIKHKSIRIGIQFPDASTSTT